MINIVFTTLPLPFNDTEDNPSPLRLQLQKVADWVSELPETRTVNGRIMVQGIVHDEETILSIQGMLTQMNLAPKIVWVGDLDTGLQLGTERVNVGTDEEPIYEIQGTATYPFDEAEYNAFLNPDKAPLSQVNKFAGMPDRDLTVR